MSHRGGKNTRSRKWALLGSRDLIDYTSLTILGNLVKEFEGRTVPSVAELDNLLENETKEKSGGTQENEPHVYMDTRRKSRNTRKRRRSTKKNDESDAVQDEQPLPEPRLDLESISVFYNAIYSRYGGDRGSIFRNFLALVQRYKRNDIDESSVMSQAKHLLRDAPDLFAEFKAMIHGEQAHNVDDTKLQRQAQVVNNDEDTVKDFLSRARSKMEFHAYNAFLDAMVELRAMYRLHKGAQAVEKLEQVKFMLDRVDPALRSDLDRFFPLFAAEQSRGILEKRTVEQSKKHFLQWQQTQLARNVEKSEVLRPKPVNDEEIRMHAMAELQKWYSKNTMPQPPKKSEKHVYQPIQPFPAPPRPNMYMRHPEMASQSNYYNTNGMNNMYYNKPPPVSSGHWSDSLNNGQHNYMPVSALSRREEKFPSLAPPPSPAMFSPSQSELSKLEIPSLQEGLNKNKSNASPQNSSENGFFLDNSRPLLSQNSLPTPFTMAIPPVTSVSSLSTQSSPPINSTSQPSQV